MTNNKYTPQSLSKKLAELGIKIESEKYYDADGTLHCSCVSDMAPLSKGQVFAYTLSNMPEVLKAVGEIKRWNLVKVYQAIWKQHFLAICNLYATSPDKAWQYLEDLIDNK